MRILESINCSIGHKTIGGVDTAYLGVAVFHAKNASQTSKAESFRPTLAVSKPKNFQVPTEKRYMDPINCELIAL